MLTINQDQRDALLYVCDELVEMTDDSERESRLYWRPFAVDLIEELVLPDADGSYAIRRADRQTLAGFLIHELMLTMETGLEDIWRRIFCACVSLLTELGQAVDMTVLYDKGIGCDCGACVLEAAERKAMFREYGTDDDEGTA